MLSTNQIVGFPSSHMGKGSVGVVLLGNVGTGIQTQRTKQENCMPLNKVSVHEDGLNIFTKSRSQIIPGRLHILVINGTPRKKFLSAKVLASGFSEIKIHLIQKKINEKD